MPTQLQLTRLRADLGLSEDELDDLTLEDFFVRAEQAYTLAAAREAQARIYVYLRLQAAVREGNRYTQNQSSEDNTKAFDNYAKLIDQWTKIRDRALVEENLPSLWDVPVSGASRLRPVW